MPQRWRRLCLLVSSYFFYSLYSFQGVAVLFAVSAADYVFGRLIAAADRRRGAVLAAAILLNVATLCYYKYSGTLLLIGISFYIFQALSYLIDVYLEKIEAETNFGCLLLYLAFFPKLLQGPIERAESLLPQLHGPSHFDWEGSGEGVKLLLTGFFKKVVIADRLSVLVAAVFDKPAAYHGLSVLIAVYAYTLQIYFDLSGYTDIARGIGKLFGIELSENFDRPYFATNIQDFWRRWHISFSSWLRDYLFLPLMSALRDWGTAGVAATALITFVICGFWHGATWGFIVFGSLHGAYMAVSILTLKTRDAWIKRRALNVKWVRAARTFVTFNMVAASFVFFRTVSLSAAFAIFSRLWGGLNAGVIAAALSPLEMAILLVSFACLLHRPLIEPLRRRPALFYAIIANAVIFLGIKSDAPFIYFQF